MRIAWVVPCRYVEVNENLATIVGGGIDRIWVPTFPPPTPVQVLCATRVVAELDELDDPEGGEPQHTLTSRVFGPDMEIVSELSQPFGVGGEVVDPTIDPAVIIPIGVVFEPVGLGQHTVEIAVDDRSATFPLTVALGPPA